MEQVLEYPESIIQEHIYLYSQVVTVILVDFVYK